MNSGTSAFSFSKILSGLAKTLGVANQVIPLYQQTKPLFKNARTAYELVKGFSSPVTKKKIVPAQKNNEQKRVITSNNPQFFI